VHAAKRRTAMDRCRATRARRRPGAGRLGDLAARRCHLFGEHVNRAGGVFLRRQHRRLGACAYRRRPRAAPRGLDRLAVSSGVCGGMAGADDAKAELARASAMAVSTSAVVSGASIG
jgi:hypothetical protein